MQQFTRVSTLVKMASQLTRALILLLPIFIPAKLWAIGQPYLVKNINPYANAIEATAVKPFTVLGNNLIFSANDGATGQELWTSDGTDSGTQLIVNIRPGPSWSSPENLTTVNNMVFFTANDGVTGKELWVTDGSASGTQLLKDIYQGSGSSNLSNLTSFNGMLFFTAASAASGTELWRSDGTPEGTILFREFTAGSNGTTFGDLKVINNKLMIALYTSSGGGQIVQSDGTPEGTQLVHSSFLWQPELLTPCNGLIFFRAATTDSGTELWQTDGTDSGIQLMKDIYAGTNSSNPQLLTCVGTTLFFAANSPAFGTELWKSDGIQSGTVLVKDIYSGAAGSSINNLTELNGKLIFQAYLPETGGELWQSDGTESGTTMLADINPGSAWSSSVPRFVADGKLFLQANYVFWLTDGTTEGTHELSDITYPSNFNRIGDTLYFSASRSDVGNELWAIPLGGPVSHIISPQAGSVINMDTITISGDAQAEGDATVVLTEVSLDGGTTWATATGATNWNYSWSPVADGTYTVMARSIDSNSVTQAVPEAVNVTIDRVLPTASLQINNNAMSTTYRTVTLSLTASATEAGIDCTGKTICGSPQARFSNDGTSWSFWEPATATLQWDLDAVDGLKSVYVQVKDRAGNTTDISNTIVLDASQVPSSTIISPVAGFATNGSSVIVTGTAAPGPGGGAVTLVEVSADGGLTWQSAAGTTSWSINLSLPSEGSVTIKSRARNNALVEPVTSSVSITVDRTSPTGYLALYYGEWTLNASDGGICILVYPFICGFLEMSLNGITWQTATTHPGTGGPLWLRDQAGNVSYISGSYGNVYSGPVQISRATPIYYSLIQHAYDAALNNDLIKLTAWSMENLTVSRNISLTIRGGYNNSFESIVGTTPINGNLRLEAGSTIIENIDVSGNMTINGGDATVSSLTIH